MICEEEAVSFQEAERIAKGLSNPVIPKWTLAFKIVGGWAALIFGEKNEKKRNEARALFRQSLTADELQIFDNDPAWQYTGEKNDFYNTRMKSSKKKAKKGKMDKDDWKAAVKDL